MKPIWLPTLLKLDWNWDKTVKVLYQVFTDDFISGKPQFRANPVWWDNRKMDGNYDEGFWHLITKIDNTIGDRIPDMDRAIRLPWCAPVIINSYDSAIKCWEFEEDNRKKRTYIWLEEFDYIVILEKRKGKIEDKYFLITAYVVEGSSTRKKLTKKYDNRIDR